MDIILKEDIQGLGKALELVKVKTGFAHNFLFPRNMAVLATSSAKKQLEAERAKAVERTRQEKASFQAVAEKMKELSLTIAAKVSEGEKLYGSVQASDISAKLKEAGYDVDKRNVLLAEPIKQLGMYTLKILLHKDVEVKIKLWIISDESK
jgi:large subunit ribosomal protein L9